MKQTRYFRTLAESSAFSAGLFNADEGHIHSIETGTCEPFEGFGFKVTWVNENKHAAELPEKHPPLTPDQYVAHKGAICPVCHCRDLGGDPKSGIFDNEHARLQAYCRNPDCEASWIDCYELSGYDNLET